jgi:hypothetical protein
LVFSYHEARLCITDHVSQAIPLFSSTPDRGPDIIDSRRDTEKQEATEKIAKWAIELSMYDIIYKRRTTIKAQALSDFMAEWTETQTPLRERELEYWTINFDGSLKLQGVGVGILVTSLKGKNFKYVMQMHFLASNNAAVYKALLHGLRIATTLGIHRLKVLGGSLLIVN